MNHKPKIFVALSYEKEDETIKNFFIGILENDFSIIPADLVSTKPPQEKVPELIRDADIFAAILTKRYEIQGNNKWKPSDWIQQEIGMAQAYKKRCLIFKEKGVELAGIILSITTVGEFERESLEESVGKFIKSVREEARKVKEEKIIKIEGWHDTKRVIEDIIEGGEKYIYGIVEDFSSIDKFENYLDQLNENIKFELITSPFGDDIAKLERIVSGLKCKKKEIRFIHPSKIGKVRILFNERFGLFVIHARGDEYFGIRVTPIDDLKTHFNLLKKESFREKEPVRLEGKFCRIGPDDLAKSLIWAIKGIADYKEKNCFLYVLGSRFTLFVRNQELRDTIIDLAKRETCKIDMILSQNALDRGNHQKSLYDILSEEIGGYKHADIHVLNDNYPVGQRRIIITNKLAMNILDFDDYGYYYSVIQDHNHINMMKNEMETIYLNQKKKFC